MTTQVKTFEKHIKSAKIGTLVVDRIRVGKEWTTYTPTFSVGATGFALPAAPNYTSTWRYKINGTSLKVKGFIYKNTTVGTHSDSTYLFPLPTGCAIHPDYVDGCFGMGFVSGSSVQFGMYVISSGASNVALRQIDTATTLLSNYGLTATTDVNIRASINAALTICISYEVELDPACAALAGNPVP